LNKLSLDRGDVGRWSSSPQPKSPQSLLDAPVMSIGASCRPRRYRAFHRLSSGPARLAWAARDGGRGCSATNIRDRGPFQRHGRYGCGLDDHLL